eukprot:361733-Amphidinium_carterae.1
MHRHLECLSVGEVTAISTWPPADLRLLQAPPRRARCQQPLQSAGAKIMKPTRTRRLHFQEMFRGLPEGAG